MSSESETPAGTPVEPDPTSQRCKTCRFWLSEDDSPDASRGVCARFPPVVLLGNPTTAIHWHQPWTLKQDWCGEWRPKK